MMPIKFILQEYIIKSEYPDIESIGARLKNHGYKISVDNQFSSDCGDEWKCQLLHIDSSKTIESNEPSLRSTLIAAFKQIPSELVK